MLPPGFVLDQDEPASTNGLGFSPEQFGAYRDTLSDIESGGQYGIMGGAGGKYAGKYQFGGAALKDTAAKLGVPVPRLRDFLADPDMQEKFMETYTGINHERLSRNPKYASMAPEEQLATLGYAWNQGAGGANKYLNTGQVGSDGFGTPGTKYSEGIRARLQPQPQMASAAGLPPGFELDAPQSAPAPEMTPEAPPQPMEANAAPEVNVGEDVVQSGIAGLERGVISLATLPGDVQSYIRQGLKAAGIELPENMPLPNIFAGGLPGNVPTSQQATEAYEGVRGPLHEPQTTAGEFAETLGEFAPAAIGGGGGIARRAAQVAIPAVASETAGQVTRQVAPEYEDAARISTAIATGGLAAKPGASKLPKGAAPGTDEIKQMATLAYKRAENAGLEFKGSSFRKMAIDLIRNLKDEGLDQTLHPRATAAMRRLAQTGDEFKPKAPSPMAAMTGTAPKQSSRGIPLKEMDTLRQVARDAAKSIDPNERRLGSIIIGRIDDFLDSAGQGHVQAGNWPEARSAMKEARSLWHRMRKSEQIDDIMEVAKDDAGQFSVSGHENAIRKGFRQLSKKITKDKREAAKWTPEELKLIRQLAGRMTGVNLLRTLGKLAPRGAFTIGGGILAASQDPVSTGAVMGASSIAHLAALGLTKKKAGQLVGRVRSGNARMIPGAPASPGAAALAAEASTVPWRDDQ